MRSRNKLTQLLALFLALLTVVSVCPLSVSAESGFYEEGDADYDNTGGTSKDKSGEFNLSYTGDVAKQIVGYRITGIKARVSVRAGLAWLMMNRYVLQVKQVSQKRSAPSVANRWRTVFLRP